MYSAPPSCVRVFRTLVRAPQPRDGLAERSDIRGVPGQARPGGSSGIENRMSLNGNSVETADERLRQPLPRGRTTPGADANLIPLTPRGDGTGKLPPAPLTLRSPIPSACWGRMGQRDPFENGGNGPPAGVVPAKQVRSSRCRPRCYPAVSVRPGQTRSGQWPEHSKGQSRAGCAARTSATMPALMASGSVGQASTTVRKSESNDAIPGGSVQPGVQRAG